MKLYPIFCLLVLSLQAEVDCRNIDDVNVDVGSGIAHNLDTFSNSLVVVAVDSLVQVPDGGQEQRLQVEQQEELQYKVQQERLDENQQLKVHQLQGEEQKRQAETNTSNFSNTANPLPAALQQYIQSVEILNRQSLPLRPNFTQKVQDYFQNHD